MNPNPGRASRSRTPCALCLVVILSFPFSSAVADGNQPLTLSDAEHIALRDDPEVGASLARAEALRADAVADAQLPDPKLRTGLYNLPLDDLDIRRVPTTQLRVGIQQAFPRGDTLKFKSLRTESRALLESVRARQQRGAILRDVRKTFLDVYFQVEAARIIRSNRRLFKSLTEITRVQYASGGSSQQDVLRAELELSRLDDRLIQVKTREDLARAELSRWIGPAAWRSLPKALPELPSAPDEDDVLEHLEKHPEIGMRSAIIETHRQSIAIAKQQYRPGWTVGAEYRMRFGDNPDGSGRSDMAALMLTVDLPLFRKNRQDKRVLASQKQADAAFFDRDNTYRKLRERVASVTANLKRLNDRIRRYDSRLSREARANARAALDAYQNGTLEFTGLMRARITELEIRLQALKLRVDRLKNQAGLLYLAVGEEQ